MRVMRMTSKQKGNGSTGSGVISSGAFFGKAGNEPMKWTKLSLTFLTFTASVLLISGLLLRGVVCAAPRRSSPEMSSTEAVNVRKVRLSFVHFMGSFPALPKNAPLEITPDPVLPFPFCFDVILITLILATLFEPHLTEIDCDHQHFHNRSTIRSARVGAPLGWQTYAVRHHIIRSQLRRFKTARDIHAIVMAAQPQILAEEKILHEVVRLDRTRKVGAQHAPHLCSFPPVLGFLDLHAIHREKKGGGEIGPYGFAIEIGTMKRVPRRVHLVARERVNRRTALRNYFAIELLDGNPIWREHRPLIGSPVRPD